MSAITTNDSAATQLLKRNLPLFNDKKVIVAGALADNFAEELAGLSAECQLFCLDYRLYRYYQQKNITNLDLSFDAQFNGKNADFLLLYMPKSKAEARYLLANLTPFLSKSAQILLVGENRGGISSAPKLLSEYCSQPIKIDGARRCSLYRAVIDKPVSSFIFADWFEHFSININDISIEISSLPGVFSHGRLDVATRLLLERLNQTSQCFSGRLLDFGCGAGIIASFIAKTHPKVAAELVDINALSLASSRATLKANNINAKVYASDVYSDITGRFKHIISNPPFHAGLNTHYSSTETFLEKSINYLEEQGDLTIVANSFLKYQAIIDNALSECEVLSMDNKFNIYYAKNKK